jgi:hypothetical protein
VFLLLDLVVPGGGEVFGRIAYAASSCSRFFIIPTFLLIFCSAHRRWKRKWLKRERARGSASSSDSDSSHSTNMHLYSLFAPVLCPAIKALVTVHPLGSGAHDREPPHSENMDGAAPENLEQLLAPHTPSQTAASVVPSDFINPVSWFRSRVSENVLDMLNPVNWFSERQTCAEDPSTAVSDNADDNEAACRALGVTPDFFSPVGSRLSEHGSSDSGSHSDSTDNHTSSGSSRTSQFSEGTYESSSDSGSGSSVPSEVSDYQITDRWNLQFQDQFNDSSDGVIFGSDGDGGSWDY